MARNTYIVRSNTSYTYLGTFLYRLYRINTLRTIEDTTLNTRNQKRKHPTLILEDGRKRPTGSRKLSTPLVATTILSRIEPFRPLLEKHNPHWSLVLSVLVFKRKNIFFLQKRYKTTKGLRCMYLQQHSAFKASSIPNTVQIAKLPSRGVLRPPHSNQMRRRPGSPRPPHHKSCIFPSPAPHLPGNQPDALIHSLGAATYPR